uniref:F-box only protein 7-like n=1 Tax=Styela clava TaxID=7725 RepID=UPI001939CDC5|nr:F-box only protein 7-like [Styela clava]
MKLRVRFEKKTKIITIEDEPQPTFETLKSAIRETAFGEWGINIDASFQISLDGKTCAGEGESNLKSAGIVSGDLIKVLLGDNALVMGISQTSVEENTSSVTPVMSEMSVASETFEQDQPGPSTVTETETTEYIPCSSPGPIFFRDCNGSSDVPHLVQKLYEDDFIKNEFQALCITLHFMMCESGFYIEGMTEHSDILPHLQSRIFAVEYSHAAGPDLKFNFTCNQLGSFVLVNGVAQPCRNTNEQVLTLQITTKDYIQSFTASTKNSNAAAVYKNLSKLNRQVKETIAHPALNNMREELQLPPVHGLLSLFPEILQLIFSQLDCKSLISLSQVNKALQDITNDENLWRNLYIKDFKSHPISVENSWKKTYSKRFVREKERKQDMERYYRDYQTDPWPQFPTPIPGQPVPFPDQQPFGMIGGEHDLHPTFPYGPFATPPRRLPPARPNHPMHPDNPLPGSRYDPIFPGGGFRPGRGGGMMDADFEGFGAPTMPFQGRQRRSRHDQRYGFM